jgi:hypothetical protein
MTALYREARKGHKTRCLDGKNCAIPSLHRDSFLANPEYSGLPGAAPDASVGAGSGNTTSPYCRAVMGNCAVLYVVTVII